MFRLAAHVGAGDDPVTSCLSDDEVRDIRTYLTVLNAIGEGAHALKDIANATLTTSTNLTKSLSE